MAAVSQLRNLVIDLAGNGTVHVIADLRGAGALARRRDSSPTLGPGEAAGQLADVVGANQLAYGGVVQWRHRPVIAGCAAAPDPPPRVLAPERPKFGIPVVPARPRVHGGQQQTAGRPRCCGRRARAWTAAGAMQLPPPGGILGAGQPGIRRRARRTVRSAHLTVAVITGADGRGADRRSATSGSLIACASCPVRGRVRVTRPGSRAAPAVPPGGWGTAEDHARQQIVVPAASQPGGDPCIS